jgi:hypothetical protein
MKLKARLELLARNLDAFEAPGFQFGAWQPARTNADGSITLGWYELARGGTALMRDVAAGEWVQPFDWMSWLRTPRGQELSRPDAVAGASAEELQHLLTAIVRSDRFSEGSLGGAYESGLLLAILRRARALIAELLSD